MKNYTRWGFDTLSVDALDEYRASGVHLRHGKTGAEVYRVHADDRENLFSFAFHTPPGDSSGVPHILEHTVLCGSERYPLKDPFLVLLKGSAHTYLNAATYPDKTIYPAASTVEADFRNLLRVYGDAVFFPLLKPEAFMQEGHRLEFDEQGRLIRAGVVLNEMKGSYSSAESVAGEASFSMLFPDTPYRWDSGGNPLVIPSLTYEDFKAYHRRWYHPSNVRVFLYGSHNLEEVLSILDGEFFSRFEGLDIASGIPLQRPWSEPRSFQAFWPSAPGRAGDSKSTVSMNWLWDDITSPDAVISAEVLSSILLGHSGSPLQKAIVESGLGEDLSPVSGLETDARQMIFSAAVRGIPESGYGDFEKLVLGHLEKQASGGLDRDLVEGAMRMVEFRSREIRGGSPFGMRLMKRALRGWMHGRPPAESLVFEAPMARLRERAVPGYFEENIRTWLLDNPHRSTVTVSPGPYLQEAFEDQEREILDELYRDMQEAPQKTRLEELNASLEKLQVFQDQPDSPEDLARIPFLSPEELPDKVRILPLEEGKTGAQQWFQHNTFTNGVSYLTLAFDVSRVEAALQPLLPLLGQALTEVGLPGCPYHEAVRELSLKTGGLGCSLGASAVLSDAGQIKRHLFVHLKALSGQWKEALELTARFLASADFSDEARVKDLLLEMRNDYRAALIPSGHAFTALRASARHSAASSWEDLWYGVGQLQFLQQTAERIEERGASELAAGLGLLAENVFQKENMQLAVTADPDFASRALEDVLSAGLGRSGTGILPEVPEWPQLFSHSTTGEALEVPASVSFSALSLPAPLLGTAGQARESLLAHVLSTGYLWEAIRMKGGAYGAFASVSGLGGYFTFSTYRDPHIQPSLQAFRQSLEWAASSLDKDTLRLAKIGAIGKELRPPGPGEAGFTAFKRHLYGISDQARQQRRDCMLSAGAGDIQEEAARMLDRWEERSVSVLAGNKALNQAAARVPELAESRVLLPH